MDSAIRSTNVSQANASQQVRCGVVPVAKVVTSSSTMYPHKPCGPYSLLLAELPDLFQDLFLQIYEKFIHFSRLPLEIRLSIWRFSFPRGRLINMDWYIAQSFECEWDQVPSYGIETSCSLPPTLYVNQESRRETLNHYRIIPRPCTKIEGFNVRTRVRPLCYSPLLDTMFFTDGHIMDGSHWKWLHRIKEASLETFNKIEELEIRNWHCCMSLGLELASSLKSGKLFEELAFFFQFPGLKSVNIVLSKECSDALAYGTADIFEKADIIIGVEMLFQKYAPHGTASPKVTVQSWKRLSSRVS